MTINLRELQKRYKADAVTRAIVDWLGENGADHETDVDDLEAGTGKPRLDIIHALKELAERTGCGTFLTGRRGHSSRMRWEVEPGEIHGLATGSGDALVAVELETRRAGPQRPVPARPASFPGLEACVSFYSSTQTWPEHVLSAARDGLWVDDVPGPEWKDRLDRLERAHERIRSGAPEPSRKPSVTDRS